MIKGIVSRSFFINFQGFIIQWDDKVKLLTVAVDLVRRESYLNKIVASPYTGHIIFITENVKTALKRASSSIPAAVSMP
jgi:hypothetical protein